MASNAMCLWTLRGLVSAFFDLAVAYFLLSGAALAYFASTFLRFFGLGLPCPCHQFFGNATLDECWKGCLVNAPFNKISSVQSSVKNKFPFDSVLAHEHDLDCGSNSKPHECAYVGDEHCVELKSQVSPRSSHEEIGDSSNLVGVEEAAFGIESKEVSSGDRFLKLCRNAAAQLEKLELDDPLTPPASANEYDGRDGGFESMELAVKPRDAKPGEEKLESFVQKETTERDLSVGLFRSSSVPDLASCSGNQESVIEILEKALEKEQNSRTALYMELEKERTAASTAAEEAMAMIFRLQEEKAEIEMDARQYHRIIEEKSAYDMEEMNILKEIVIRREREKHYLEKEVEGYKQLILERERWDGDGFGQIASSVYSSEDSMLPWIGELVSDQKEKEVNLDFYINQGLQEKARTSMEQDELGNEGPLGIPSESSSHQPVEVSDGPNMVMKGGEQCERYPSRETKTCDEPKIILPYDNHAVVRQRKSMSDFDFERSKIDKEIGWLREGLKGASIKANGTKNQSLPRTGSILNRQTSDSDKTVRLQPFCSSPGTASIDFQRKSMSAFDTERTKIDSEVGWLRERLKLVHEGRGKLKISGGRKEREKAHMQMLDDIASQLRQIRHLTEPGKVLKKAALPPLSSKAIQKRRQSKTGSLEVGKIL